MNFVLKESALNLRVPVKKIAIVQVLIHVEKTTVYHNATKISVQGAKKDTFVRSLAMGENAPSRMVFVNEIPNVQECTVVILIHSDALQTARRSGIVRLVPHVGREFASPILLVLVRQIGSVMVVFLAFMGNVL